MERDLQGERVVYIREQEKMYHDDCYRQNKLFEPGSWLHKPVRTVMELLAAFDDRDELQVLDLGCGIGRNSIPVAETLMRRRGSVVCVDLLESAIANLAEYSRIYGVESVIRPILSSIEDFAIEPEGYDYIVAVSTLEHICSLGAFEAKLAEMVRGTKTNGLNCIIIGTGNTETAVLTGEPLEPLFEINLPTAQMLELLEVHYAGWEIVIRTVKPLVFDIERQGQPVKLATDCLTFAARKRSVVQI